MTKPLTESQAMAVFDIIVKHGGKPSQYNEFMHYFTKEDLFWEFRGVPKLGFGGKIKRGHTGIVYVTYYHEDFTNARELLCYDINSDLDSLQARPDWKRGKVDPSIRSRK